ncbi:DNA polymerase III subunit delta [Litoribrevibacter euphylliae]|uniref:DNA polymerase III subunit delta n=1 Tax=Litoribrevibacter euphylliae TaxID=1834034 RepID=A0ABV7HHQ5_9GAMM
MEVKAPQLPKQLSKGLHPIYLIHGDETLIVEEALDNIRAAAKKAGHSERIVFDVETGFSWSDFSAEAQALSLFSDKKVIELRLPNARITDKGKAIVEFCDSADGDTVVIIRAPKLDKNTQKQAWYKAVEKSGITTTIWPLKTREVEEWSASYARKQGKSIEYNALQLLLEKTEGNLLATKQELDKLSLAIDESQITLEALVNSIADSARYTIFDLSDNCLKGDLPAVSSIFNHLKAEGAELLSLSGMITKEIRTLNTLINYSQSSSIELAFQKAKVWKNKQGLYRTALQRLDKTKLENLLKAAHSLDMSVKGMSDEVPWQLFYEICLALAGNQQFRMRKTA